MSAIAPKSSEVEVLPSIPLEQLWREFMAPLIVLEYAYGDGTEERDTTPLFRPDSGEVSKQGKFWVYERIIRMPRGEPV